MAIKQIKPEDDAVLQSLSSTIAKAKRIIFVTGAGISTSCGIPDFRSTNGLYNGLNDSNSARSSTKSLFDANMLRSEDDTARFNVFMASLRQKIKFAQTRPSSTHKFIKHLADRGQLKRCYTQNIDGLEPHTGLNDNLEAARLSKRRKIDSRPPTPSVISSLSNNDQDCEVIPLHGRLSMLRCMTCSSTQPFTDAHQKEYFSKGVAPPCDACFHSNMLRALAGRRSATMREGFLRPDIVLYGEEHPQADTIGNIMEHDLSSWGKRGDLVLIMGTSLAVKGVQRLVRELSKAMKTAFSPSKAKNGDHPGRLIFVNNTAPSASVWGQDIDSWVEMPCDDFVDTIGGFESSLKVPETVVPRRLSMVSPTKRAAIMPDTPLKGHSTGLFTPPNSRPTPRAHKLRPAERSATAKVTCLPQTPQSLCKNAATSQKEIIVLSTPPTSPAKKRKRGVQVYDVDEEKEFFVLADADAEEELENMITTPSMSKFGAGILSESTGNKRRARSLLEMK